MKLSETVKQVICLGDASRAYWERELHKRHPNYPLIHPGESSAPPPPEDARIQALLTSLPEDQLYTIILLAYVGRGDFSADHLPSAFNTMKETFPSKEVAIAQMTGNETLAEYLTDAMEEIQKRHIDLDSLKLSSTAA